MSSHYSSNRDSSNRDSSSRGGRSRNGGGGRRSNSSFRSGGGSRGEDRPRRDAAPAASAKKQGFFSKILSIFGLGGSKKTPAKSGKSRNSSRTDHAPRAEGITPRRSRKPERIEVTTPRVYVGNLSFDATESDLLELFGGIGSVQNVEIVANRDTHRSKGFGFVQLSSVDEAKRAVTELHDKEYMGRKMVVSGAKAVAESRSERSDRRETASERTPEATANEQAAA